MLLRALALVLAIPVPAPAVVYRLPVAAPIVDGWRPPSTPFGPGNRGIDFGTTPGQAVATAGAGTVRFAGQVGGSLVVSVVHADGIETTYSPLRSVAVWRGEHLADAAVVGTATADLHWGALRDGQYIDPLSLVRGGPLRVWLVSTSRDPATDPAPTSERVPARTGVQRPTSLTLSEGSALPALGIGAVGIGLVGWGRRSATLSRSRNWAGPIHVRAHPRSPSRSQSVEGAAPGSLNRSEVPSWPSSR